MKITGTMAILVATLITFGSLEREANGATLVSDFGSHTAFISTTANAATIDGRLSFFDSDSAGYRRDGELNNGFTTNAFSFSLSSDYTTDTNSRLIFANNVGGIWDDEQVMSMDIMFYDDGLLVSSIDSFKPDLGTQGYPIDDPDDGISIIDISSIAVFDEVRLNNFSQSMGTGNLSDAPFGELAIVSIPEPSSVILMGLGALGIATRRRRTA